MARTLRPSLRGDAAILHDRDPTADVVPNGRPPQAGNGLGTWPLAPIMEDRDHQGASIFVPESLLREARRQKGLEPVTVPPVCVLDPDGDLVSHLRARGEASRLSSWPCYHTDLWEWHDEDGLRLGVVDRAVGASFAVLIAEQLFASGCRFLISLSSAGQIVDIGPPPYFLLIDRALRDEGTSYHYLAPATFVAAPAGLVERASRALAGCGETVHRGAVWTTDAPFRETAAVIAARRAQGVLAVEMEAAALYAFAQARRQPALCLAHISNRLGQEGDFEKGVANGACAALTVITALARDWLSAADDLGARPVEVERVR